jgi:hypothetical protein
MRVPDSNDIKSTELTDILYNILSNYLKRHNLPSDIEFLINILNIIINNKNKSLNIINRNFDLNELEQLCVAFKGEFDNQILRFLVDEIAKIDEKSLIVKKNSNINKKE